MTTARSGELISSGTIRKSPEKQLQPDVLRVPMATAQPPRRSSQEGRSSTLGTSSSASKPPIKSRSFSSQGGNHVDSSKFRSVFSRETQGHGGGGGLANWEQSFRPFDFGPSSPEKMAATDDWKKEFLYHDDDEKSRWNGAKNSGSGVGPPTDLVYSKTTTTRTRGGSGSSRSNLPPRRSAVVGSVRRGCVSDSEDSWNWLEEQRTKLETRRTLQEEGQKKIRLERQLERQRSEVEGRLLNELRGRRSSTLSRPGASDLRYRARSMDNVGVDLEECEIVGYSRFGPTVQRRTSRFTESLRSPASLRSRSRSGLSSSSPSPREPPAYGYGRRGCQTLPRDARLTGPIGTAVPPSSSLGQQKKGWNFIHLTSFIGSFQNERTHTHTFLYL